MNCPNCGQQTVNINGRHVCLDCGIEALEQKDFDNAGQTTSFVAEPKEEPVTTEAQTHTEEMGPENIEPQALKTEEDKINTFQLEKASSSPTEEMEEEGLLNLEAKGEEDLSQGTELADTVSSMSESPATELKEPQQSQSLLLDSKINTSASEEEIVQAPVSLDSQIQNEKSAIPEPSLPVTEEDLVSPPPSTNEFAQTENFKKEPTVEELSKNSEQKEEIGVNEEYHGPEEIFGVEPEINSGNPIFEEEKKEISSVQETSSAKEARPFDTIYPANNQSPTQAAAQAQYNYNENLESFGQKEGEMDVLPANMVSNGAVKKIIIITAIFFLIFLVIIIGYFKYSSVVSSLSKEEVVETPERIME